MAINLDLSNFLIAPSGRSPQTEFFNCTKRNQCLSGGFGLGKTWIACKKVVAFGSQFPNSRWVIGRVKYTDLMRTTVPTFFKVCPESAIKRQTKELVELVNGTIIYFMHFTDIDESVIRGLELNGAYVDQAEELQENIALLLSTRIGRWDEAIVPPHLLKGWKNFDSLGKPRVPPYFLLTVNPDSELHWIYRRFHPDSLEHQLLYSKTYEMIQASSLDNPTLDKEIIAEYMSRDQVFIDRFVYGKWGISESAIHRVNRQSIFRIGTKLEEDSINGEFQITLEWLENFLHKAKLFRVMDHGDTAPTCCLWFASWNGTYLCYREYYQPDKIISYHRKAIQELSRTPLGNEQEHYAGNYADPDIFTKHSQKAGIRFSVSDEYLDTTFITESNPIAWIRASNDEFGTRNRINECLSVSPTVEHLITTKKGAPRLYFLKKSDDYPNGCYNAILQIKGQKRVQIGTENAKPIFSEERDDKVVDHAYDPIRYFISVHHNHSVNLKMSAPPGSFFAASREAKKLRLSGRRVGAY